MDVPETVQRNYQSISDMEQEVATVPGKRFFVHVAGETKNAHQDVVAKLNNIGLTEVRSPGESDYLLVFCPVVSRVKPDIKAALQQIEGGTPVILVVMHHTFNPNSLLSESRSQVENPNVHLTVDVLFYEGKLLQNCNVNDNALHEVKKFFNVSETQDSWWSKWNKEHRRTFFAFVLLLAAFVIIVTIVAVVKTRG